MLLASRVLNAVTFGGSVVQVEQSSTNRLVSRLVWLGCGALGLLVIASVATPAVRRLVSSAPQPLPVTNSDEPPPHWSAGQVGELIVEINGARSVGLEPKDYGIAALRSELERRGEPTLTEDSVQLDRLAEASALVLAEDLSRLGMADHAQYDWHAERVREPRLAAALHAALAKGRLRAWLHGLRPPAPQLSSSQGG
jgi:murein L,D-transpeptidase YcbB/YkuD